jgi:hypothetical protein
MPGQGKRAWLNHDEPAAPQKGGWLRAIFAAIAAALAAESDRWFVGCRCYLPAASSAISHCPPNPIRL